MPAWSKATVLEWFRRHVGQRVVLRQPSTLLRVTGAIHDVGELDACSADYHTVDFTPGLPDVEMSLSFHDATLSLHVLAKAPHQQEAMLSLPVSIPYGDLELYAAQDESQKPDETIQSPYELLR